ncbi:HEAT repeat domain-containing protein [Mesorhizobium sp. ZC-5]|uniref:HEAT repeat domain-containing protein n=1 Tax=Mesorhizobium sp. ZC-5 TaxID=2986066 RepID=UPI0021E7DEC3|nr:HEAT repeat domain-containing protein [Mesorhizobium sp. ZC-5]MCV3238645.1 HEAT repeat domain-containing protein [Mesorhizobium sp. ZC-5]
MLVYIWTLSIVIGLIALVIMAVLVVLRVFHERRHARDEILRRKLMTSLIRFSEDGERQTLMPVLKEIPAAIVADSGFEFLSLLRGGERRRIEEAFAETSLPDFVRKRLRKGNEAERIHSAEILTAFPGAASVDALLEALGDNSRELRIAAAISLNALGALPPLQTVLERIGPKGLRSHRLIDLFESLPAERGNELLANALKADGAPFVRAAAVEALSLSEDYRFLVALEDLARDPSPEVAAAALRALGRSGHPGASGTVLAALGSADWEVRREAAEASGRIGIVEAVEPLTSLLGDGEWAVRYAAGKSLREIGPAGMEALQRAATEESSRSQRTASLILSEGLAA